MPRQPEPLWKVVLFSPASGWNLVIYPSCGIAGRLFMALGASSIALALVTIGISLTFANVALNILPHSFAHREANYRNKHRSTFYPGIEVHFGVERTWLPGFARVVVEVGGNRQRDPDIAKPHGIGA